MSPIYPHFAKSERKDSLVPDPQEYDMYDPERTKITLLPFSTAERLKIFDRLISGMDQESER